MTSPARRCDALPQHRGLPVPWVALWDSEVAGARFQQDSRGVYWWTPSHDPGQGQALFQHLHPIRQRDTMLQGRCQVCNAETLTWLLPAIGRGHRTVRTTWSPVCAECEPVARARCPHLVANPPARATTTTPPRLVGYLGRLLGPDGASEELELAIDDPRLPHFVANQAIAELVDLVWADPDGQA